MFSNLDSHIDNHKEVVSNVDSLENLRSLIDEEGETRSRAIVNTCSLFKD